MSASAPVDNLVRARYDAGTAELRAKEGEPEGTGRTLHGHFAVFDTWTRIESWFEGTFMERIAKGAFKRTWKEKRDQIRVLYEHGRDPSIGNKPLGAPDVLREDDEGAYYESELFDAEYVNQLMPAFRAKQMGASFRFRVTAEEWVEPKKSTDRNPEKIPERTIREVEEFEHGPCPFGAYVTATAGVRSGTDAFLEALMTDPRFVARFTERTGLAVVEKILAMLPDDVRGKASASTEPTDGGTGEATGRGMSLSLARAQHDQAFALR